jgi:hypothetical protein
MQPSWAILKITIRLAPMLLLVHITIFQTPKRFICQPVTELGSAGKHLDCIRMATKIGKHGWKLSHATNEGYLSSNLRRTTTDCEMLDMSGEYESSYEYDSYSVSRLSGGSNS